MLCLSVCLLLFFSYGHSKQTRSLLLLDLYYKAWRTICDSYHGFYPRLENLFHVTDCRSEGVLPANTLKRLVSKRKYTERQKSCTTFQFPFFSGSKLITSNFSII